MFKAEIFACMFIESIFLWPNKLKDSTLEERRWRSWKQELIQKDSIPVPGSHMAVQSVPSCSSMAIYWGTLMARRFKLFLCPENLPQYLSEYPRPLWVPAPCNGMGFLDTQRGNVTWKKSFTRTEMGLVDPAFNPSPDQGHPTNPPYTFDLLSSLHGSRVNRSLKLPTSSFKGRSRNNEVGLPHDRLSELKVTSEIIKYNPTSILLSIHTFI